MCEKGLVYSEETLKNECQAAMVNSFSLWTLFGQVDEAELSWTGDIK